MEQLNPDFSLSEFYKRLELAKSSILMLDYDGTLAPFTPDRKNAVPYDGVKERLNELIQSDRTEIIIISGRDIETLKRLLDLKNYPRIWGCHGAERYHPDTGYKLHISDTTKKGLEIVRQWAESSGLMEYTELKPSGCAFHWRGLPEDKAVKIRQAVLERWQSNVGEFQLMIEEFDGGIELRAAGIRKSNAVSDIIKSAPANTICTYLGDDLTDEDAFDEIGDAGLKVLVSQSGRETKADIRIIPPDELLEFLDNWIRYSSR